MNISLLVALAALLVSITSFVTGQINVARSERLGMQPTLVFEYSQQKGWHVRNVGNGPALNPVVSLSWDEANWEQPVRIPSVAQGSAFRLQWIGHQNIRRLGARYSDAQERPYSATGKNDQTFAESSDAPPIWANAEVEPHWTLQDQVEQSDQ